MSTDRDETLTSLLEAHQGLNHIRRQLEILDERRKDLKADLKAAEERLQHAAKAALEHHPLFDRQDDEDASDGDGDDDESLDEYIAASVREAETRRAG